MEVVMGRRLEMLNLLPKWACSCSDDDLLVGEVGGSLSFINIPSVTVCREAVNQLVSGLYFF